MQTYQNKNSDKSKTNVNASIHVFAYGELPCHDSLPRRPGPSLALDTAPDMPPELLIPSNPNPKHGLCRTTVDEQNSFTTSKNMVESLVRWHLEGNHQTPGVLISVVRFLDFAFNHPQGPLDPQKGLPLGLPVIKNHPQNGYVTQKTHMQLESKQPASLPTNRVGGMSNLLEMRSARLTSSRPGRGSGAEMLPAGGYSKALALSEVLPARHAPKSES